MEIGAFVITLALVEFVVFGMLVSEVILHVPPLRNRTEDIPQLALAFLKAAGERHGKHFDGIEPDLVRKFRDYDWPGNVRELRNAIDRMAILYDGPTLRHAWWDPPQKTARGTGAAVDALMGSQGYDTAPALPSGGGRPVARHHAPTCGSGAGRSRAPRGCSPRP